MEGEFYNQSTLATKRKDEEVLRENVPAKRRKTVPSSWLENGKRKLQELRARMECERNAWVWSGGKEAEEDTENSEKENKTKRMERREKLVKKTYYSSLVGFLPFWKSLKVDKLETIKDKNDRFWQGFLSDPSGSGISVQLHCLDQT